MRNEDTSDIRVEHTGRVGWITIDRPHRHNSLDVRGAQDLRRAGLRMARDESVGAVVIRGLPGTFCSGADLKYVRAGGEDQDLGYLRPAAGRGTESYGAVFKQILEYLNSTISEIRRAPKPFIAAVDGVAAAGGLGIALCCDLVLASESATFEWAYGKTGLTGAESATFFLPRLIGLGRALDMALLNPRVTAQHALHMGMISEVFPEERFEKEVAEIARRLADGPTAAYARTKLLLNQAAGMDGLEDQLDLEVEHLVASAGGDEFAGGLERFFARRKAR